MCGIVGYIGTKKAQPILLSGLKRLEYRGYDSAGVVTFSEKRVPTLLRSKGKVADLEKKTLVCETDDKIGIGHTRWATHGAPNEINAHPHHVGAIYLVHNGIIENYKELRSMLENHGYTFKTETDSEVLTALIDMVSNDGAPTLLEAVSSALKLVVGTYGIAVVSEASPAEIIVARKGSPLILGVGRGETFIASDASALLGYTSQVIYLKDDEIARCTAQGVELFDNETHAIESQVEELKMDLKVIQKEGFDHFLLKEIFEQPESLRATLSGRLHIEEGYARLGGLHMSEEELRSVQNIIIVGCGTAYYAGLLARYYIENLTDDVTVQTEIASELRYRSFAVPKKTVALIVSQSGETADTLACLQELKRRGVRCLGIVNAVGSTIAREVDGGTYVHVGAEISVASTKAFTSQVVSMVIFGLMLARAKGTSTQLIREYMTELQALPAEIEKVLKSHSKSLGQIGKAYKKYDHALYIGRDTLFPIALEGALKLKEVSYVHAEGYASGELKHGPIALIDKRFFEVCYTLDNWLFEKSQSNLVEMNARGAHAIVITDSQKHIDAETVIRVKTNLKQLTPLLFNVVSQLFAYYMAVEKGNDVDQPRNLAKSVTVE